MGTTTSRVIINILSTGGGGSPPEEDPTNAEELYFPSAYESLDFFVEFEFLIEETTEPDEEEGGEAEVVTFPASTVETTFDFDAYNITYTSINDYTFRIEGPILNVFQDQFYQFVLPDLSTPQLPFDTEEEFLSLIKYQKPASNTIEFEYDFLVNNTFDVSVYQIIVWRFQTAVNNIANLVSKGLK